MDDFRHPVLQKPTHSTAQHAMQQVDLIVSSAICCSSMSDTTALCSNNSEKLKRRQFSEFPFVAASEIVPQSTQVSETLKTEPSTTLLPLSVSVLLGLLCKVTSSYNLCTVLMGLLCEVTISSAYVQYYWAYCVK